MPCKPKFLPACVMSLCVSAIIALSFPCPGEGIASRKKTCAIEVVTGTARDIAIMAAAVVGNGREEISAVAIPLERRITAMAVAVELEAGQGGGGAQLR